MNPPDPFITLTGKKRAIVMGPLWIIIDVRHKKIYSVSC